MRASRDNMKAVLSDFVNDEGYVLQSEVFTEFYVNTATGNSLNSLYPDALVPHEETDKIHFTAETIVPFYINVRSTADTPAGDYTANLHI